MKAFDKAYEAAAAAEALVQQADYMLDAVFAAARTAHKYHANMAARISEHTAASDNGTLLTAFKL